MLVFMLLFLPLFLAVYCLKIRSHKIIPAILIGSFSAVLVVAFKMLFLLSYRIVPCSYGANFVYYLLKESLLPVIILYGLYFLISKENIEFKINIYLPLFLSFYSVYLPYCIISTTESVYSWFVLFLKPVIFGIMINQTGVSVRDLYRSCVSKNVGLIILNVFILLVYLIVPAVIDTLFLLNTKIWILFLVSCLYVFLPLLLFIFQKSKSVE